MIVVVVNLASNVTEREALAIIAACSFQLTQHYAADWGYLGSALQYGGNTSADVAAAKAKGHAVIVMLNHADQADALGYHDEHDGVPDGKVFTDVILDNGGSVLGDPLNPGSYSVSGTLSHEALELEGDKFVNGWSDDGTGQEVAQELCDAVEDCGYVIGVADPDDHAKTVTVCVSDFVLPEWFNPQSKYGPWSHLDKAPKAFGMTSGGYLITRKNGPGSEEQVFPHASTYPSWKHEVKGHKLARTFKRGCKL